MRPKLFSHTILLSYPRSGNHLFRLLIEAITRQNTRSIYPEDSFPMVGLFTEVHGLQTVYKAHRIAHFKERGLRIDPQKTKLILLLRDPYECVASDMKHHPKLLRIIITYFQLRKYLENMDFFRKYKGEKCLVYYESFYENPQDLIRSLAEFLGHDPQTQRIDLDIIAKDGFKVLTRKAESNHTLSYYREQRGLGWTRLLVPGKYRKFLAPYNSIRYLP